jgi:hypothetical protein
MEVYETRKKILGYDHPDTISTLREISIIN